MTDRIQGRSLNSLCAAVKVLVARVATRDERIGKAKARNDADMFKAGVTLLFLKEQLVAMKSRKPMPWYEYVEKHCDLSREHADRLIRLAKSPDGETMLTKMRAADAARKKKAYAESKTSKRDPVGERNSPTGSANGKASKDYQDPTKVDTCDFDPHDPRQLHGEPYRVTRLRGYLRSTDEALMNAERNLFIKENKADWAKLEVDEVTDEVIQAAQEVADAWADAVDTLRRWSKQDGKYVDREAKDTESCEETVAMGKALH